MTPSPYPKAARPTTYNGVRMRSRLEAGYAQWLDRAGLAWQYEPQCFGSLAGQWLPDFRIDSLLLRGSDRPRVAYVECKYAGWDEQVEPREWSQLLRRMKGVHESERESVLLLEMPGGVTYVVGDSVDEDSEPEAAPHVWVWGASRATRVLLAPFCELCEPPWHGEWWKR